MTTTEIYDLLKCNDDCNFIATCGSLLQINGVNAALQVLKSKGVTPKGYVIIEEGETFKREDYKKKYFFRDEGITYIDGFMLFTDLNWRQRIRYFFEKYRLYNCNNSKDLYIIADSFLFYMPKFVYDIFGKRKIVFCEIDDGILNYRRSFKDDLYEDVRRHENKQLTIVFFKCVLKVLFGNRLIKYLRKQGRYIDCKTMIDKGDELIKNNATYGFWKDSFLKNIESSELSEIRIVENSILILGTNYDEEYFESIKESIKTIVEFFREKGVVTVIKPHPRDIDMDRYRELGCEVLKTTSFGIEEMIAGLSVPPKLLIGFGSTALVTGKVLFDIPTIDLRQLVCKDKKSEYSGKLFARRFGDTVECISDKDSLKRVLNTLIE